MKCPHETHILLAATENNWTSTARAHVASCESCAAAAAVAPFMARLAGLDVPQRALPDPALLWLRAQLPGPAFAEKVGGPVRIVQVVGYLAVAATSIGLVVSKWGELRAWAASLVTASGSGTEFPALALSVGVLVLSSLAALALHTVLADEG